MKIWIAILILPTMLMAQSKGKQATNKVDQPIKWTRCAEPLKAYGGHVRFTVEEVLQMQANSKKQDQPYREWELAASTLNWFDGTKRVPLSMIKSHMPRAMLLRLRFPVDQNPPVVAKDLEELIKAEKDYYAVVDSGKDFFPSLMKKYGIGPTAIFDQDMGGATPIDGCGRYEDYVPQPAPMPSGPMEPTK